MNEISEDDQPPTDDEEPVDAAVADAVEPAVDGAVAPEAVPVAAAEVVASDEPLSPLGKPWSKLTTEELWKLPVQTIANEHPELVDVHARVIELAEASKERRGSLAAEDKELAKQQQVILDELGRGTRFRYSAEFDALPHDEQLGIMAAREAKNDQVLELRKVREGVKERQEKLADIERAEFLKIAALPVGERVSIAPTLSKGLPVRETITDKDDPLYGKIVKNKDGARRISTGKFSKEYKANIKEGVEFVSSLTSNGGELGNRPKQLHEIEGVNFHAGGKGLRAFAKPVEWDYHREGNSRRGVFGSPTCSTATVVHELGHVVDGARQGLGQGAKRSIEFLKYRTADTPTFKLKARLPNYSYKKSELGNEDHFLAVYDPDWKPGKTYTHGTGVVPVEDRALVNNAAYVGKPYGDVATEVISMGVQQMYEDPLKFAVRDPEWFRFTLGMLRGKYDKP